MPLKNTVNIGTGNSGYKLVIGNANKMLEALNGNHSAANTANNHGHSANIGRALGTQFRV